MRTWTARPSHISPVVVVTTNLTPAHKSTDLVTAVRQPIVPLRSSTRALISSRFDQVNSKPHHHHLIFDHPATYSPDLLRAERPTHVDMHPLLDQRPGSLMD